MVRFSLLAIALALVNLTDSSIARADVSVRVPFVQVDVGGPGVYVRAPFVRIFVPSARPVYYVPANQPAIIGEPLPAPKELREEAAPKEESQPAKAMSLVDFARSFQATAGVHEATLINPITKESTVVRFTLPEGTPRRVRVGQNDIEFNYGVRRFVRIEFDNDGAQVVAR